MAVGNKIYSFGQYCDYDDQLNIRPIDVQFLQTGTIILICLTLTQILYLKIFNTYLIFHHQDNYQWSRLKYPDPSVWPNEIPSLRVGHSVVVHNDLVC